MLWREGSEEEGGEGGGGDVLGGEVEDVSDLFARIVLGLLSSLKRREILSLSRGGKVGSDESFEEQET